MTTQKSIIIKLAGDREIRFEESGGGRIRAVTKGVVTPRELAEAKTRGIQKLADATNVPLQDSGATYTPRHEHANPARNYSTRLLRRPQGGGVDRDK